MNKLKRSLILLALGALVAFLLIPILLAFVYSLCSKPEMEAFLKTRGLYDPAFWMEVKLAPHLLSLRQYYAILLEDTSVLRLFVNSSIYALAVLAGQAVFVPPTAYALSRFHFRGRDTVFLCVLMLMLLPFQVTMVANVLTLRAMGLMNTIWAVILPACFSPFLIFLIRQFMLGLPNELFESASMDGAGAIRSYLHIALPVCRPVLGAAAALSFADCWNLVEQPLVYLSGRPDLMPLSVMFNRLGEENGAIAFAGAAIYILPALLIYMLFQQDIVAGIQLSELK